MWGSLDNEMRPSISYYVNLALDPWKEVTGPVVRTFSLRYGQARRLPRYQELYSDGTDHETIFISGTPSPVTLLFSPSAMPPAPSASNRTCPW